MTNVQILPWASVLIFIIHIYYVYPNKLETLVLQAYTYACSNVTIRVDLHISTLRPFHICSLEMHV